MIESASTADIMFWLIHPAIERLLAAKRLENVNKMGVNEFYKWPQKSGNNETWLEFSYYTFALGANPGFKNESYRCVGHGRDDPVLPNQLTYTGNITFFIDILFLNQIIYMYQTFSLLIK